uniref:Aminotransferase, class V superfamily protein n=1 Tax=Toxoplasma gondii COUG TaxID=1074873 RepID=A0A2G8XNZ4_TOXGO|nr:aminotransferase, class V superfamily protein [Toxoplasma gondii COUG]
MPAGPPASVLASSCLCLSARELQRAGCFYVGKKCVNRTAEESRRRLCPPLANTQSASGRALIAPVSDPPGVSLANEFVELPVLAVAHSESCCFCDAWNGQVTVFANLGEVGEGEEVNRAAGAFWSSRRPGNANTKMAETAARDGADGNARNDEKTAHCDRGQSRGTGARGDEGGASPFEKKVGESYAAFADRLHNREGFPLYLDNNSSTKTDPRVFQEMAPFFESLFGNPGSAHERGRINKAALEEGRERVAGCLGVPPSTIFFTSGATESLNWAIKCGATAQSRKGLDRHIVTTRIEHPAVLEICKFLEEDHGFQVTFCPVDCFGFVNLEALSRLLRAETAFVSVPHANAEIGAVQPIEKVAMIVREHAPHALLHVDCSQSLGKIPVNIPQLGADLVTIAGHKIYAPKGVGALYVGSRACLGPLLHGGGQERRLRGGTENVPYCVALGKACELIAQGWSEPQGSRATISDSAAPLPRSASPGPLTSPATGYGESPEAGASAETRGGGDRDAHSPQEEDGSEEANQGGEGRGGDAGQMREEPGVAGEGEGAAQVTKTGFAEEQTATSSGPGVRTPHGEGDKPFSWLPSLTSTFRMGSSCERKREDGPRDTVFPASASALSRVCVSLGFSRVLPPALASDASHRASGSFAGEWGSFSDRQGAASSLSAHPKHMEQSLIKFTQQFFAELLLLTQWSPDQLGNLIRINGPLRRARAFFESGDNAQEKSFAEVYGALPNTLSLSICGADGPEIVRLLCDRLCISAGCTCHSSGELTSTTLQAIQLDRKWARGTIRISTGRFTTLNDAAVAGRLLARFLISENMLFGKPERVSADLSADRENGELTGGAETF